MANITVDKKGNIKVVDDKKKSYGTPLKVGPDTSKSEIRKLVLKAIGMNATKPGVSALAGKADSIADSIYSKMQKAEKKEEQKKEVKEKPEKKAKEKPAKKEKAEKKKKEKKAAEILPTKKTEKTVTVSISEPVITNVIGLAAKKKDKKLENELQKLADSYTNLRQYVESNAEAVTVAIFNALYAKEDFVLYLNAISIEDPAYGKLISQSEKDKLTKNSGTEMLELADTAMRSFLESEMDVDKNMSKEIESIGGIDSVGKMDAKLFFSSLLYLRRAANEKASILNLKLVETVEKPIEKEKPKVKYKL